MQLIQRDSLIKVRLESSIHDIESDPLPDPLRQSKPPPLSCSWMPCARPSFKGGSQIAPIFIKPLVHFFSERPRPNNPVFPDPVVAPAWKRPHSNRWLDADTLPIVDQPSCRRMQSNLAQSSASTWAPMDEGFVFHADVQRSRLQVCQVCRDCFDEHRRHDVRLPFRIVCHGLSSSTYRDRVGVRSVHHAFRGTLLGRLSTHLSPRLHRQSRCYGRHIR